MTTAQLKMKSKLAALTINQLCESFELTNGNRDEVIPIVRGAIMDELESRHPDAFNAWMESDVVEEMEKPSKFFK